MKTDILKKYILPGLVITFFGFILLNLTFIFDAAFQSLTRWIIQFFTSNDSYQSLGWFPPFNHIAFAILIGLISWLVFKSKLKDIYKAIYLTVPTAVVLVTFGIMFWQTPVWTYMLGGLSVLGTLYYFYLKKLPWIYYYAVILVGFTLTIGGIFEMEI